MNTCFVIAIMSTLPLFISLHSKQKQLPNRSTIYLPFPRADQTSYGYWNVVSVVTIQPITS